MKDPGHHQDRTQRKVLREVRREERMKRNRKEKAKQKLDRALQAPEGDVEKIEWIPLREPLLRKPSRDRH